MVYLYIYCTKYLYCIHVVCRLMEYKNNLSCHGYHLPSREAAIVAMAMLVICAQTHLHTHIHRVQVSLLAMHLIFLMDVWSAYDRFVHVSLSRLIISATFF